MRPWALLSSLLAVVLLACTAGGDQQAPDARADAAAQRAGRHLMPYLFSPQHPPNGFTVDSTQTWSNAALAGALQDTDAIRQLVTTQHVVQLRQGLTASNGQRLGITLFLDLYLDANGARGAISTPAAAPGAQVEQQPAPGLGSTGMSTRLIYTNAAGAQQEEETVGAASGRVATRVSEAGPPGTTRRDQVLALLTAVMTSVTQHPPPAASSSERSLVATETTPRAILRDSYAFLLTNDGSPLDPAHTLASGLSAAAAAASRTATPQPPTSSDPNHAWAQFNAAYDRLAAGAADQQALAYATIAAMYDAQHNCHTVFYPPDRYARLLAQRRGADYARIGVALTVQPPLVVLRVTPGSPAEQAGVRAGDRLLALDHQTPDQVGATAFGQLLAGAAGTTVLLTVVHPGTTRPVDLSVLRAVLPQEIERHARLPGDVGYIELESFPNGSAAVDRVTAAIQELAAAGPVHGWVLDLRLNQGGSELAMQQIAGLFLPAGSPLVRITTKDGATQLQSLGNPLVASGPLAILVGPATASSAEMLTEALRQLGRATVVGTRTAGCVNGGEIVGLLDGSGLLLSTQQVRVGPRQVALEGIGIAPDHLVDLDLAGIAEGRDTQLDAALSVVQAMALPAAP